MNQELNDLRGNRQLTIIKKRLDGLSAEADFEQPQFKRGTSGPGAQEYPNMRFYISTGDKNFFKVDQSAREATIFHEASHYVGTEDDTANPPILESANQLETLYAQAYAGKELNFIQFEQSIADDHHSKLCKCKEKTNKDQSKTDQPK